MLQTIKDKVSNGHPLTKDEAILISGISNVNELLELFYIANNIREKYRGSSIDLCAIVNAKSGACPEDCSYCAQSSKNKTQIDVYPLVSKDVVLQRAKEARDNGVNRFCIVTSGKKTGKKELLEIASMIEDIRKIGLLPCATLGLLGKDELSFLKDRGLERYHHNLETSERFFPEICSTHTYKEKLRTIKAAKLAGLSVCCGGIFGMGETWQDRVDMCFALKEIEVDSIPINYLMPIKGTPMANMEILHPFEALKIISIYRLILPEKEIRICGGRNQTLREFNSLIFMAGADALLTGNYLTTTGRTYSDDLWLIKTHGLNIL